MIVPEDMERRRVAKRHNERVKLASNALNAIAIAIIGAAVILPTVASLAYLSSPKTWILILFAVALHVGAHAMLTFLRSED